MAGEMQVSFVHPSFILRMLYRIKTRLSTAYHMS